MEEVSFDSNGNKVASHSGVIVEKYFYYCYIYIYCKLYIFSKSTQCGLPKNNTACNTRETGSKISKIKVYV